MLDLNPSRIKGLVASDAINAVIDAAQVAEVREARGYLGASSLGHDCMRKIAWDWRRPKAHEARTLRIFQRGHWWESYCVSLMLRAGFRMVREGPEVTFSQLGGLFGGHGDGKIVSGPELEHVGYPCAWECKGLGSKGWKKLEKDGLARAYPAYADQVALYQAYFDLTEHPAVFTACNMDTMEILHLLVEFDPARAQAASDRAVAIVQADAAGETLPRIGANPDDWRCRFCSHREECWA